MNALDYVLNQFIRESKDILGENLVGIYLHGSAVMDCFNEDKSDVDLLVVVKNTVSLETKLRYMDMVMNANKIAPKKGLELSIVKEAVCNTFVYPTPFELHYSIMHLEWYKSNPLDYVERMNGIDKDLAAHFTIIYHRGKCLYGKSIKDLFGQINKKYYFDSIWNDISNAEEEIINNPTYLVLNLCRVLAFKKDGLILSKKEGGDWGLANVTNKYHGLILKALDEYSSSRILNWDETKTKAYATYMIKQIKG